MGILEIFNEQEVGVDAPNRGQARARADLGRDTQTPHRDLPGPSAGLCASRRPLSTPIPLVGAILVRSGLPHAWNDDGKGTTPTSDQLPRRQSVICVATHTLATMPHLAAPPLAPEKCDLLSILLDTAQPRMNTVAKRVDT